MDHPQPLVDFWADKRILGRGGSAVVSQYDDTTVLKGYVVLLDGQERISFPDREASRLSLVREREVYEQLGSHSHILQYYGEVEVQPDVHSLRLELASNRDLRTFIRENGPDSVPIAQRLAWTIDIASGLAFIHSKGVFHCDFSCRNVFVTKHNTVKIGDFGGAKLNAKEPFSAEEPWYELPLRGRSWEARPYVKRELFALGCAIYEIMAWKKPFAELDHNQVEKCFACEEFPDLTAIYCARVIEECWKEKFESATEVVIALKAFSDNKSPL